MNEELLRKALDSAYRYLARGPRSRIEVERRLRQKNYSDPVIRKAIQRLEEYRYIDDRTLARQWTRDRVLRGHWGPLRLRMELERKGVAREWVEEAVRELFGERDEKTHATELAAQRLKGRGLRDPKDYRRLFAQLIRRGYSSDVAQSVLQKMKNDSEPSDERND
ncbi:MAG TPA: regulatory protein RecX [Nitrospiria bacterium]|nr:regulatory protein RecX [Nitrospiria bacterium]